MPKKQYIKIILKIILNSSVAARFNFLITWRQKFATQSVTILVRNAKFVEASLFLQLCI